MSIALEKVNLLDKNQFEMIFADIAEHSPWVASFAAEQRPFSDVNQMVNAFKQGVNQAPKIDQLALINAHPDLAGKAHLTPDSKSEQAGAGLDSLTVAEMADFTELNTRYKAKFHFPFIFAVKGADKYKILDSFKQRINNEPNAEFDTAMENIFRIFMFRIEDQVQE